MKLEVNKIYHGDSFILDKDIPDKSVDMVLEDMPYGITACEFDQGKITDEQKEFLKWFANLNYDEKYDEYLKMIYAFLKAIFKLPVDLAKYWESRERIIKDNGAIVLTGSQPFTSLLVISNLKMFKYEWIWNKIFGKEPFALNRRPMKAHENITIFYNIQSRFNAQKMKGIPYIDKRINQKIKSEHYIKDRIRIINNGIREPISIIDFRHGNQNQIHPTQKSIALFEYLVKTYTNEGDLVFDGFSGSGTTAIACYNTNRNFICIEKEQEYYDKSIERLKNHQAQYRLAI